MILNMIQKRETKDDLIKQERLFQVFSNYFNLKYNQFQSFSQKYRIDGYCYDENTKNIMCWIECKWYSNKAHCFLNVSKFRELINLSELTFIPSYLVFREHDKWGYIMPHNGKHITCNYTTKLTGGTPKDREQNDDDIEPLIIIDKNNITWGN